MYISVFITSYARVKLYKDALEVLQEKVLYFDMDSTIYVYPAAASWSVDIWVEVWWLLYQIPASQSEDFLL